MMRRVSEEDFVVEVVRPRPDHLSHLEPVCIEVFCETSNIRINFELQADRYL